jgi:hypothetical protein
MSHVRSFGYSNLSEAFTESRSLRFVIAKPEGNDDAGSRLRTYHIRGQGAPLVKVRYGMGATMSIPLNFAANYDENTSLIKYSNHDLQLFNPAEQLLDEARRVFGSHRSISALVSLGNGMSKHAFDADKEYSMNVPEALVTRLRRTSLAIEEVHSGMTKSLEPGSYYRFDPTVIVQKRIKDDNQWRELFAYEVVKRMDDMEQFTKEYLQQSFVKEQLKNCAEKLKCRRQLGPKLGSGYQPEYIYPKE